MLSRFSTAKSRGLVPRLARDTLLRQVYEPFSRLKKGSPEYEELALSGRVWEDYFQPGDSEPYRYLELQKVSKATLCSLTSVGFY